MGIWDRLSKVVTALTEEETPESFKKGQKFEQYAREVIFPKSHYTLLKKTHDYTQNRQDFVEETMEPDYKFRCLETGREFYVEAKFRSGHYNGKVKVCKNTDQLLRYKEYGREALVFLLLGMGEEPVDPEYTYLFPIEAINDFLLSQHFVEEYSIPNNRALAPAKLWASSKSAPQPKREQHHQKQTPHEQPQQHHREQAVGHKGFCIRCKQELKPDPNKPLCPKCYAEWNKYKNPDYKEKYCHLCGKNHDTSVARPLCLNCFKQMR